MTPDAANKHYIGLGRRLKDTVCLRYVIMALLNKSDARTTVLERLVSERFAAPFSSRCEESRLAQAT